jgi:tellurite resistance protein TerC
LLWGVFGASILIMLALDLGVFHRKSHDISIKEALMWSVVWLAAAAVFNILIYIWMGSEAAIEFTAGYIVERTLSFDNLFVFLLVFSYFKVPSLYQYRVLFWGILAALVLRGLFIVAGIELIDNFHWIIYFFGAFLLVTGLKMFFQKDKDSFDVGKNPVIRLCRRYLPTTDNYDGGSFFIRNAGKFLITPLFIVLLVAETSDIIFAFDSVPAILGITLKPFVVYTSNIFAILGLRALYFALAGCMVMFHYLSHGVKLILIFIGVKMLLSGFYEIHAGIALGIIVMILAVSVGLSMALPQGRTSEARQGSNSK